MEGGLQKPKDDKKNKYFDLLYVQHLSLPKSNQECNSQGLIWSILSKQVAFELTD